MIKANNTLLKDEELKMLIVLRMNRVFMELMRADYGDMLREQFGMQVVMN